MRPDCAAELEHFDDAPDGLGVDTLDFEHFAQQYRDATPEVARAAPAADAIEKVRGNLMVDLGGATPVDGACIFVIAATSVHLNPVNPTCEFCQRSK